MESIQIDVLDIANKDGLIGKKLTKSESLYLHNSVVTANKILDAIGEEETELKQIAQQTKLNTATLKTYLKWLQTRKLIKVQENGSINLYKKL